MMPIRRLRISTCLVGAMFFAWPDQRAQAAGAAGAAHFHKNVQPVLGGGTATSATGTG